VSTLPRNHTTKQGRENDFRLAKISMYEVMVGEDLKVKKISDGFDAYAHHCCHFVR